MKTKKIYSVHIENLSSTKDKSISFTGQYTQKELIEKIKNELITIYI